ncbi:MAG: 4Fe-4S single cluster domain-containing protein [Thermodesulfobacteriota bacterium]
MERDFPVLNIHRVLEHSRANGPGVRIVVWFQGCSLRCTGCFNPQTHSVAPRTLMTADALADRICAMKGHAEGISLTGGEPLDQAAGVCELLRLVRRRTGLSVLLFSGYTMDEMSAMPAGTEILSHLDVLIAGRYLAHQHCREGIRGSSNQTVRLLTSRYSLPDVEQVPPAELTIDPSGRVTVSGVHPPSMTSLLPG